MNGNPTPKSTTTYQIYPAPKAHAHWRPESPPKTIECVITSAESVRLAFFRRVRPPFVVGLDETDNTSAVKEIEQGAHREYDPVFPFMADAQGVVYRSYARVLPFDINVQGIVHLGWHLI